MGIDLRQLPEKMQKQALEKIRESNHGSAGSRSNDSEYKHTAQNKNAQKASKYANERVEILGEFFDSKKEARRWVMLKDMEDRGEIRDLRRQVKYELIPAQYETYERYGKRGQRLKDWRRCVERALSYYADFDYIDSAGNHIVEDAKGMRTDKYIIKRKLMLWIHGIRVTEV